MFSFSHQTKVYLSVKPVDMRKSFNELLAYVTLSKYRHHLPLYRHEKMSAHWTLTITKSFYNTVIP